MKICWMIPPQKDYTDYNRTLASVWIRCFQMIEPFERIGYQSVINKPNEDADIYIFFRVQELKYQKLLNKLKKRGKYTIFIVGINYYERIGNQEKLRDSVLNSQIQDCIIMTLESDMVIVSSEFLKERALRFNTNVHYIPDSVTKSHFRFTKDEKSFRNEILTLVWSGHAVKSDSINMITDVIKSFPFKLKIIAEKHLELDIPFEFAKWKYETFPQEIVSGDICISPRELDNSYDMAHSNFKIMVFLVQGVPVLASPQGSYVEVIKDGYNGFICHTLEDWKKYFIILLNHRDLLVQMSLNAQKSAEPYLTEKVIERYDAIFKSFVKPKKYENKSGILGLLTGRK